MQHGSQSIVMKASSYGHHHMHQQPCLPILRCSDFPSDSTGGSNSTLTVSCTPAVPAPCGSPAATGTTLPRRPIAPGSTPNSLNATCVGSNSMAQDHLVAATIQGAEAVCHGRHLATS
eukprot:GHUV01050730.1.p1 GENE.GHUV01050730.1~~GHUV01050730.1.p1  ORF type:complete len:118 (+),score=18.51 GHUV01050730.1:223-576(+)